MSENQITEQENEEAVNVNNDNRPLTPEEQRERLRRLIIQGK